MSSEKPSFSSEIPEHLLANASPESKWLMTNISVLTQKTDYLVDKMQKVEIQTTLTNGTVKRHTEELAPLKELTKDLSQLVGTKRFIERFAGSKYFWGTLALVCIGGYTVLTSPTLWAWMTQFFS